MNERTIIRPGGRRNRSQKSDQEPTQTDHRKKERNKTNLASLAREQNQPKQQKGLFRRPTVTEPDDVILEDTNVLFSTLSPIILLTSRVKISSSDINLEELRTRVKEQLEYYRSINFGLDSNFSASEDVSYGLCCLLDEMVLNTPWGAKSNWANESLLVTFHKETWGGERFFELLEKMSANPSKHILAIEFYYAILELGFEGKFRHSNDGMRSHQVIKNNTYLLLENYKNLEVMPLSDNWESTAEQSNSLLKIIPQWIVWSVTFGFLIIFFFIFSLMLSNQSDPIKRKLVSLRNIGEINLPNHEAMASVAVTTKQVDLKNNNLSILPILTNALSTEIVNNLLVIEQRKNGVSVRLTNANLFRSGSDALAEQYIKIIEKMGQSLANIRVTVNVTGHSDDIPIRTIKYSDNWALSEARANSVKNIIERKLKRGSQVFARGLADTVNLVPNTNSANRALNRRVEILVRS